MIKDWSWINLQGNCHQKRLKESLTDSSFNKNYHKIKKIKLNLNFHKQTSSNGFYKRL